LSRVKRKEHKRPAVNPFSNSTSDDIYICRALCTYTLTCILSYIKGKAVPLQAWSGPEGSSKLRFPDFMTTAQEGGKVVSLKHRPHLPSGNPPGTHFC